MAHCYAKHVECPGNGCGECTLEKSDGNNYRVFLTSKESWLKLNKPNTIAFDVLAYTQMSARVKALQLIESELGETDYKAENVILL